MTFRRDAFLIALLALFTNVVYFVASNGDYTFPDSMTYLTPAENLLHGRGLTDDAGFPETLRTPVYPLVLVPFIASGATLATVVFLQHLLVVALAVAIYCVTRRRLGNRFVAIAAATLFAVDPSTIHYANKILTETLFTAGLFVLFVLLAERRAAAGAAILLGILILLRPVAIVFFIVAALFYPRRGVPLFVALSLVLPLGWAVRNKVRTGVFTVSPVAGINMLQHRAAGALAMIDAGNFKDDLAERQEELLTDANDVLTSKYHVDDAMDLDPAIRGAYYGKVGTRIALQHPIGLGLLIGRGVLVNLFDSDWEAIEIVSPLDASLIRFAVDGWTHAFVVLAIIGIIVLAHRDKRLAMLIAATVLYFVVISAGGESEARFRVPIVPQLAIAAAFGIDAIRRAAAPPPR